MHYIPSMSADESDNRFEIGWALGSSAVILGMWALLALV